MLRSSLKSLLMVTLSAAALSACSGGDRTSGTPAPMPPISEMDAAMSAPAPQQIGNSSDTLTPVASFPSGGTTEERLAALEQSVSSLRADMDRMAPAFASLNTTNERIQSILTRMENGNAPRSSTVTATTIEAEPVPAPAMAAPAAAPRDILPPSPSGNAPARIITSPDAPPIPTASGQVSVTKTVSQSKIDSPRPVVQPVSKQVELEPPVLSTTATTTTTTAKTVAPVTPLPKASPYPAADVAVSSSTPYPPVQSSPATQAAAGSVKSLRIGEHSGKTRLVFDLTSNQKPAFKYDIDNAEKIMVIDMPSSGWAGASSGKPNSPLLASWNAQGSASGGSTVAIQLKKSARVLSTEFLKAEGKDSPRLVVDIAAE